MGEYRNDRSRSDAVMSDVRWVLKIACGWDTEVASDYLDKEQATDLIADGRWRVAVRSRGYDKYFSKYGRQFTLRSRRSNGTGTELSKILKGFGDYLLYGFLQGYEHRYFYLINLAEFAKAIGAVGNDAFSVERSNGDGTFFRAYSVDNFKVSGFPNVIRYEGAC